MSSIEPSQRVDRTSGSASQGSAWSFRIATVAGIPIRIHFTFVLMLMWIAMLAYKQESRVFAWLLPSIFVCVVLHELGHALTAKAFGVNTRDITLYPIGGIAMLESRPKPKEEFWIALAGPAVNVAIAAAIAPLLIFFEGKLPQVFTGLEGTSYLQGLFLANVYLPLFNMIPAFPMDGGRVLRAALAMVMPEHRATRLAGAIGQLLAMGIGFVGLMVPSIVLILIAFFVFVGAGQEVQVSLGYMLISGRKVRDAMMTKFRTIESGASLAQASAMLLEGSQHCFPVVFGDEVLGLLTREDIIRGLATEGPTAYVAGHMSREVTRLSPDQPLEVVLEGLSLSDGRPALVFDEEGRLVGLVTAENIAEFLMVQQALRR